MNPIIRLNNNSILKINNTSIIRDIEREQWLSLILNNKYTNYLISNYGRIYSCNRMIFLSQYKDKDGYLKVSLSFNSKHIEPFIHRLVMITFCPIPDYEKYQVNHLDGNKQNNYVFNLEWCTAKQNIHHAIRNGLTNQIGENHHATYLNNSQIHYICKSLQDGKTYEQICDDMQIPKSDKRKIKSIIRHIEKGVVWTHISKDYTFTKQNQHNIKYSEDIVYSICQYLELGKNYDDICKLMNIQDTDIEEFKKFMYRLVSKDIFNHIKCQYKIKIPISPKSPLFSKEQIHQICEMLRDGFGGEYILKRLNIDINSLDRKTKHCVINCISNIKNKKTFKKISDKYFE